MIPPVTVKVEADHSCNWRCCGGCKEEELKPKTPPNTPSLPEVQRNISRSEITTTTKTVTVSHKHLHSPRNQEMKDE